MAADDGIVPGPEQQPPGEGAAAEPDAAEPGPPVPDAVDTRPRQTDEQPTATAEAESAERETVAAGATQTDGQRARRGRRRRRRPRRGPRRGPRIEPDLEAIPAPDPEVTAELVERFGLRPVNPRPRLPDYLSAIYGRRHFMWAYSRAQIRSANAASSLGMFWVVLNPILNAAVYYLIFGIILQVSRGIENFPAYLVIGVFTMEYTTSALSKGASSIIGNENLVRAFHFPRAVLPISAVLKGLLEHFVAIGVMLAIVLATGEPLSWTWFLLPAVLFLQTFFNLGLSLLAARFSTDVRDFTKALPFFNRTWTWMSGVMFDISRFTGGAPDWIRAILDYQPGHIFLQVTRDVVMTSYDAPDHYWLWAAFWAVLFLLVGFFAFWRAEERYGRG